VIRFEKEAGIEIIQLKVSNSVAVHRGNRQYTGSTQAELQMS
jgi:hypothetical protein